MAKIDVALAVKRARKIVDIIIQITAKIRAIIPLGALSP
jgi:hypothetical protein